MLVISRVRVLKSGPPFGVGENCCSITAQKKTKEISSVFYSPKKFRIFCGWDVNDTRRFGSFHWKFSGINGIPEKIVPFSRWKLPYGNLCCIKQGLKRANALMQGRT